MRFFLAGLLFVCSVVATPAALADTVNFSFSFNDGSGGLVTGEIDGLQNNATSATTAVYIDTATNNGGGDTLPYDVLTSYAQVDSNTFTVTDGVITAGHLNVLTGRKDPSEQDFVLLLLNQTNSDENALGFSFGNVSNYGGLAGATYTELPAATPEPGTLSYLAEALGGAAVMGWRGVRRRSAAVRGTEPR
jgi:hypothetical protein